MSVASAPTTATVTPDVTGQYAIDPGHSRIGFVARHAMVTKVRGSFGEFDGQGYFDAADPSNSRVDLTIQAASVDTRNADRDAHLRSNDFFAMDTYPEIRFVSTSVDAVDDNYRVTGELTIKDVTKPVTIDFEYTGSAVDPYGNQRLGLEGKVTVNRKDWGLTWNAALEAGGVLVSDKVTLEFDVSAVKVVESDNN
ncbi:MAG TPA: YceI family protein [Acidimicrobiales bacterium]|nr:YceI family protein [Acidimicrobiales bacterium]